MALLQVLAQLLLLLRIQVVEKVGRGVQDRGSLATNRAGLLVDDRLRPGTVEPGTWLYRAGRDRMSPFSAVSLWFVLFRRAEPVFPGLGRGELQRAGRLLPGTLRKSAMPLPATPSSLSRRTIAAACIALPAIWIGARAQSARLRLTPRQTEGPFYPLQMPRDQDANLLANGALRYGQGEPAWLAGSVSDPDGAPVAGARVEIWQCDANGHYDHPGDGARADRSFQGFGAMLADADGRYRFRTIRPVAYSGRTPHIHVKVRLGTRALLTTQLYVQGDPGNARDFLWRRLGEGDQQALTVAFEPASDGWSARFPIVVAA